MDEESDGGAAVFAVLMRMLARAGVSSAAMNSLASPGNWHVMR
jgi:hypothetical protein